MSSTGFRIELNERHVIASPASWRGVAILLRLLRYARNDTVLRHRFFPTGHNAKPLAVPWESAYRRPNFTFLWHNNAVDNRKIRFFYQSLFKLPLELAVCLRRLCNK